MGSRGMAHVRSQNVTAKFAKPYPRAAPNDTVISSPLQIPIEGILPRWQDRFVLHQECGFEIPLLHPLNGTTYFRPPALFTHPVLGSLFLVM